MKVSTIVLILGGGVAAFLVAKKLSTPAPKPATATEQVLGLGGKLLDIIKGATTPKPVADVAQGGKGAGSPMGGYGDAVTAKRSGTKTRGAVTTRHPTQIGALDLDEPSYSRNASKTGYGTALVFSN